MYTEMGQNHPPLTSYDWPLRMPVPAKIPAAACLGAMGPWGDLPKSWRYHGKTWENHRKTTGKP